MIRDTNNAEEQFIIQSVNSIMGNIDLLVPDMHQHDLDEIQQQLFYYIREAYLVGRVSKTLEIASDLEDAQATEMEGQSNG